MATLTDALEFLASADETDLERIIDGVKRRRQTLRAIAAAAVQVGMDITTDGLSPKYLNGLTGTVAAIKGQRADVELDEASTDVLRFAGRRFRVAPGTSRHLLAGVPLPCCKAAS